MKYQAIKFHGYTLHFASQSPYVDVTITTPDGKTKKERILIDEALHLPVAKPIINNKPNEQDSANVPK